MVRAGRALYERPDVGCAGCHPAPAFTDKRHPPNSNRAFPPLVTAAARDAVHTLVSPHRIDAVQDHAPEDRGRLWERPGTFPAPSLRGLWARPPRFLHHGGAITLREVLATPGHPALRPAAPRAQAERPGGMELGLNERDGVPDTHGGTSHLNVWELECLRRYVLAIE
jgi:cytochrome c peroxidase